MTVEKVLDELWIGVKGQSNLEISCSLRNNFRVSVGIFRCGGRETELAWGATRLPSLTKLRIPYRIPGS